MIGCLDAPRNFSHHSLPDTLFCVRKRTEALFRERVTPSAHRERAGSLPIALPHTVVSQSGQMNAKLILRDDPDRVDDTGDVAKDRQQDVDPEVLSYPDLQEHTQGREKYREHDSQEVHRKPLSVLLDSLPTTLTNPGGCANRHPG